jgi:hypothetical protein
MSQAKPFDSPELEALAQILDGEATYMELDGLFHAARLTNPSPSQDLFKGKRIFDALASA